MKEQGVFLEDKIRIQVETSRVRLHEFFIDYDRLRSGYVSKTQFQRVLDQLLKSAITSEQIDHLASKYDTKRNNTVNYREFVNAVNKTFPGNDLRYDPENYVFKNPEYLGTFRSMKQLDPREESDLRNLLGRLNSYYGKKNIDILTTFRDFDRNNIGTVTQNQFLRCMTDPVLTENELSLLIRKYQHPDVNGTVNYLNFYNDVKVNQEKNSRFDNLIVSGPGAPQETGLSVQEIVDKISVACYKEGIRIVDFFKDFDKLRSGIITDRQFNTGLTVGLQKAANLGTEEIKQLVEYYRKPDGRCDYRTFSETVENVFNIPDQEKKPLAKVIRPPKGLLAKTINGNLSPENEEAVQRTLDNMAERVRKYKIQLFTYFKDFDRSTAFTRNVTKIQFGRVLSSLGLMPSNAEYELLCKKFEDPVTGDVNYPAFCQAVDEEFVGSKIEDLNFEDDSDVKQIDTRELPPDTSNVDLRELLARIRSHALANRIRIKEFFQDMDQLNSGFVSRAQFIRCLSSFGISSLGEFNISRAQTEALCREYQHPTAKDKVHWKKFEEDVESVFTLRYLEKNPNLKVPHPDKFLMPTAGTLDWKETDELKTSENYMKVIDHLKSQVDQRRIDCWPPFKDFDKLNKGHVTSKQFYQSLAKLGLKLSEDEVAILNAKYVDNFGVNYVEFLNQIQPTIVDPPKYLDLRKELLQLNSQKAQFEKPALNDVQSVVIKIKDQVYKKRVSIYEWLRDHDKLNSGRLPTETFKRAFDLCNLDVEASELDLIANHFKSVKDNKMVEYKEFCRQVENAFGNDELEKNPLRHTDQHHPQDLVGPYTLTPDEEDMVRVTMAKIAERVRAQRMQIFPKFEDFDRVKNGNVSQNQFRRVLTDLNLASLLIDIELASIMKKYCIRIGTRDDVNYISFCDRIYELGSFEYRKP